MPLLEASNLTKDYRQNRGVFDVSLKLESGQITGFIGPNGAGKSTTINMLSGFIRPQFGQMAMFGQIYNWHTIHKYADRLGVLQSEIYFDGDLSAAAIFQQSAWLHGQNLKNSWSELAELLELDTKKPFASLSLGNRKKVGIINCLTHQPKILILDEPTSGLDPLMQVRVMDLFKRVADQGGAVLLSSHTLSEVQAYCDRIIMIKNGKILLEGQKDKILRQSQRRFVVDNLSEPILNRIKREKLVAEAHLMGDQYVLYTSDYAKLMQMLVHNEIFDFYVERPTLEEMFTELYKS